VKARAGFHHLATFGDDDGALALVVDQGEAGAFLLELVFAGSDGYAVLAEELPGLLEPLLRLLPVVEVAERLREAEERRIDQRRQERVAGDRRGR